MAFCRRATSDDFALRFSAMNGRAVSDDFAPRRGQGTLGVGAQPLSEGATRRRQRNVAVAEGVAAREGGRPYGHPLAAVCHRGRRPRVTSGTTLGEGRKPTTSRDSTGRAGSRAPSGSSSGRGRDSSSRRKARKAVGHGHGNGHEPDLLPIRDIPPVSITRS